LGWLRRHAATEDATVEFPGILSALCHRQPVSSSNHCMTAEMSTLISKKGHYAMQCNAEVFWDALQYIAIVNLLATENGHRLAWFVVSEQQVEISQKPPKSERCNGRCPLNHQEMENKKPNKRCVVKYDNFFGIFETPLECRRPYFTIEKAIE